MCPLQQVEFYRNPDYLIEDHPVTLLRIRFLCARARKLGYNDVAQSVKMLGHTLPKCVIFKRTTTDSMIACWSGLSTNVSKTCLQRQIPVPVCQKK